MRRLFALVVLALSLAMTSGPAFATPKADCPMAASGHMQGAHEDMGCCKVTCAPDCATVCPNAVMPMPEPAAATTGRSDTAIGRIAGRLPSADIASVDPPPRTTFS